MASLKKYKPITNGQRHRILLLKEQLTKQETNGVIEQDSK